MGDCVARTPTGGRREFPQDSPAAADQIIDTVRCLLDLEDQLMTVHGSRPVEQHLGVDLTGADRTGADQTDDSPADDWAVLVRPRHSRRDYVRQIVIDVALVVAVLAIIAVLS